MPLSHSSRTTTNPYSPLHMRSCLVNEVKFLGLFPIVQSWTVGRSGNEAILSVHGKYVQCPTVSPTHCHYCSHLVLLLFDIAGVVSIVQGATVVHHCKQWVTKERRQHNTLTHWWLRGWPRSQGSAQLLLQYCKYWKAGLGTWEWGQIQAITFQYQCTWIWVLTGCHYCWNCKEERRVWG